MVKSQAHFTAHLLSFCLRVHELRSKNAAFSHLNFLIEMFIAFVLFHQGHRHSEFGVHTLYFPLQRNMQVIITCFEF
jgi:hypothetical protein